MRLPVPDPSAGDDIFAATVPRSTAIRAAACTVLAAGLAAPLLRRRLRLRPPVVIAAAAATPFALAMLVPRSRARDVGMCALQMYAYIATYKMPNDDPEKLERRVHVDYPVRVDKAIGLGTTPTLRLQRALRHAGQLQALGEGAGVVALGLVLRSRTGPSPTCCSRHRDQFPRAAARIYATFDLGVIGYWAIPTAPPWYAAEQGLMEDGRRRSCGG